MSAVFSGYCNSSKVVPDFNVRKLVSFSVMFSENQRKQSLPAGRWYKFFLQLSIKGSIKYFCSLKYTILANKKK